MRKRIIGFILMFALAFQGSSILAGGYVEEVFNRKVIFGLGVASGICAVHTASIAAKAAKRWYLAFSGGKERTIYIEKIQVACPAFKSFDYMSLDHIKAISHAMKLALTERELEEIVQYRVRKTFVGF